MNESDSDEDKLFFENVVYVSLPNSPIKLKVSPNDVLPWKDFDSYIIQYTEYKESEEIMGEDRIPKSKVNERVKAFFPKSYRLIDRHKKFVFSKTEGRDPLEVFIEAVDNVLYQSSVPKFVNVQRKKCVNWLLENQEFVIYNSSDLKISDFVDEDVDWKDYCNSFLSYSVPSIPFLFAYSQSIGINLVLITDRKDKFFVFIQNPSSFRYVFLALSEGVYYRPISKSKWRFYFFFPFTSEKKKNCD